jgi:hypothetical protein
MNIGMKIDKVRPLFVECIPDELQEGVVYISERFRVCSHKCCCGCGEEVVTPLSPAEWKLTLEGDLVSLWPSVGNWDYACRSHYVIRRNLVIKALPMTERQIARVHERDAADLSHMIAMTNAAKSTHPALDGVSTGPNIAQPTHTQSGTTTGAKMWGRLRVLWRRLFGR